ncbi:hypothetical protein KY290_006395 [Solanum tuberosum]|uniref:Uncharacterized protein n=1 Tax=Solanum tuberosum TaxID=4113 RepID=A0ABQ7WIR5_SOLTU|nr:hypothetical protein KY290_006395 [Solanum tuberosum]
MESPYNPWTTSGVHKRKQRKVRDKAVPSLQISTYWLGADNTVIITKPDRDNCSFRIDSDGEDPLEKSTLFMLRTATCPPGDPDHKWVVCPGAVVWFSPDDRREFFAKLGGVGKIITIFILNLAPSQDTNDQNGINCSITEVGIPHAGLFTKSPKRAACEEEMNSILLELDLEGDITTILPGGGAHVTRDGRLIILSRDCGLHVVEQSTFFL